MVQVQTGAADLFMYGTHSPAHPTAPSLLITVGQAEQEMLTHWSLFRPAVRRLAQPLTLFIVLPFSRQLREKWTVTSVKDGSSLMDQFTWYLLDERFYSCGSASYKGHSSVCTAAKVTDKLPCQKGVTKAEHCRTQATKKGHNLVICL